MTELIRGNDIAVEYRTPRRDAFGSSKFRAVDGVSFSLNEKETLAIVGESGSGKSTLARAVLGLTPIKEGELQFHGVNYKDFTRADRKRFMQEVQVVFQDPGSSLNPRKTVYRILAEVLRLHGLVNSRTEERDRIAAVLESVGLEADTMYRAPHELSGGQKQRVAIGRAVSIGPKLIVADEALSALDVSIQAQVLELMEELQQTLGVSYLFISHDLNVVRDIADRTLVMFGGKVVEEGATSDVLQNPGQDYTRNLLAASW